MEFTGWMKATRTHHEENACVEVGSAEAFIGIRDTKQAGVPEEGRTVLVANRSAFAALVEGLRA
ncbi:DUF397 domain-containing protein [Amycolatopsis sp. NPDC004368]